jgi:hypothetical protein
MLKQNTAPTGDSSELGGIRTRGFFNAILIGGMFAGVYTYIWFY